jgi:hypothetical protein
MRHVFDRTRFGLAITAIVIVASVVYTWIAGDVFGDLNWAALAAALLLVIVVAIAGFVELFRPQNPYSRVHPMYHLTDVPPTGKLDSGGDSWIWMSAPLVIVAVILFVVFA